MNTGMHIIENYREIISQLHFFSELSEAQIEQILKIAKVRKFSKNEILFREGDSYKGFYILTSGLIKIYNYSKDGRESVVHIVKPKNVFADVSMFDGSCYPVYADALEQSEVLFIPKEGFLELIKGSSEVSLKILAGYAKRMKSLVEQIEDLNTKEVINRLSKYLVKEIKKSGTENLAEPFIKLSAPKSTVASFIGTITETFSRSLHKLQRDRVIRVKGKKIFIEDFEKLKKLAQN